MVLYASDIMRKDFVVIPSEINVLNASKLMKTENSGFLIVADSEKPTGILTEWDIVTKVTAFEKDPKQVIVKDIMTRDFVSIGVDTPTIQLVEIMKEHKIRRLPVVQNGKIIGVITSRDILSIFGEYVESATEVASKYGLH